MKIKLFTICFFLFTSQVFAEQSFKVTCDGTLKGVTIDSRNKNPDTPRNDSISDKGNIKITISKSLSEKGKLFFEWGSEKSERDVIGFYGENSNAILFDGGSKFDKDGYNMRHYHLNIDKMKLYYNRTTERGMFGKSPFDITTSIYVTNCKVF